MHALVFINIFRMPPNRCMLFKSDIACFVLKIVYIGLVVREQGTHKRILTYYDLYGEIFKEHFNIALNKMKCNIT